MENTSVLHVMALLSALIASVSAGVISQSVEEAVRCVWKEPDTVGEGAILVGTEQEFCKQLCGPDSALTFLRSKIRAILSKAALPFTLPA